MTFEEWTVDWLKCKIGTPSPYNDDGPAEKLLEDYFIEPANTFPLKQNGESTAIIPTRNWIKTSLDVV